MKLPSKKKLLWLFIAVLFFSTNTFAQELKVDEQHRGVVELGNGYTIFPENRLNNALYNKKKQLLFSIPNKSILNVLDYQRGQFLILRNSKAKTEISYQHSTRKFEFEFIAPNYGQLLLGETKSLFRYENGEMNKVNLPYRSAAGFIHNQKDTLAFYRIINYTPRSNSSAQDSYTFRVSFLKENADKPVNYAQTFQDSQATLSLIWREEDQLTVILSDEQEFKIPIP